MARLRVLLLRVDELQARADCGEFGAPNAPVAKFLKTQRPLEFPPAGSPRQRDCEGPFLASNEQRLLGRISQKPGTFVVGGKEHVAAIRVGGFLIRGYDLANLAPKNGQI